MDINITAQKGMKTFVMVIIVGIGVFLTVSAAQYGYQVWTRAQKPSEPIVPTEVTDKSVTPTPTPVTPAGSLFEPLVGEEGPLDVLDYSEFVASYGSDDPKYDFNGNGTVDDDDFEIFKTKYQQANP